MDFVRGASLADEGRAIIALPSTAAAGASSRIVATLQEGAGVVTTRAHARTIVTSMASPSCGDVRSGSGLRP